GLVRLRRDGRPEQRTPPAMAAVHAAAQGDHGLRRRRDRGSGRSARGAACLLGGLRTARAAGGHALGIAATADSAYDSRSNKPDRTARRRGRAGNYGGDENDPIHQVGWVAIVAAWLAACGGSSGPERG